MKKVHFFLLLGVICISQACNSNDSTSGGSTGDSSNVTDSATTMTSTDTSTSASTSTSGTTMSSTPLGKEDSSFAVKAAHGGMMEVELGNYAQQNALNPRVKEFGAMMVRDHSKANDELKGITTAKNVSLPMAMDDKMKKHVDDLMKKKGKEFDKDYMSMMLDDHKKDVKDFEKASSECKDSDLKGFASKTLPVLRTHLDSAKAITGKN